MIPSWGHELEAYRRRQERRELVIGILTLVGAFAAALVILVVAYIATIYVLTLGPA